MEVRQLLGSSLRRVAVATTAIVAVGALASPALAQRGHFFGARGGGFGLGPAFAFGGPGGPGGPGPGFVIGRGPGGPDGPDGALAMDVLTPAASLLGVSVDTLAADLKAGKTLAQEATAKGKTAADLVTAIVAAEKKVFDAEAAAGWITSAQETALVSNVTDEVTQLVNDGPPIVGDGKGGDPLSLAATFLGMSVSDLQAALQSGKSLADEAAAKGKSVSDLVTALVAPLKQKLDAAVTAGAITQAQENAILSEATSHITDFVNGKKSATNGVRHAVLQNFFGLRFSFRHR